MANVKRYCLSHEAGWLLLVLQIWHSVSWRVVTRGTDRGSRIPKKSEALIFFGSFTHPCQRAGSRELSRFAGSVLVSRQERNNKLNYYFPHFLLMLQDSSFSFLWTNKERSKEIAPRATNLPSASACYTIQPFGLSRHGLG